MNEQVSIAEIKNNFSEYISKVALLNKKFIITKRNKPIAALVDLDILKKAENIKENKGLSSVIGKWKNFNEILENIDKAFKSRKEDILRDVSI